MSTTKVRLLNDGGYSGFEHVEFPVDVYATFLHTGIDIISVSLSELSRIGFLSSWDYSLFFIDDEFEVIE